MKGVWILGIPGLFIPAFTLTMWAGSTMAVWQLVAFVTAPLVAVLVVAGVLMYLSGDPEPSGVGD